MVVWYIAPCAGVFDSVKPLVGSLEPIADLGIPPSFIYSRGWDTSRLTSRSPRRITK